MPALQGVAVAALMVAALVSLASAGARAAGPEAALPTIGPAPPFALTSQDGKPVALENFRGRVLAVTFIYTSCPDICPLLTGKMAQVQDELGPDFGPRIAFVSITVDPENDTPEVLKHFAEAFGAKPAGWSFLTGAPAAVSAVIRRYGVVAVKNPDGGVDHTTLTSLIDRHGMMRVQYLGVAFDPEEFRRDLQSLSGEP
jgi:protein SCO1